MIFEVRNATKTDIQKIALIEKEFSDNSWSEAQFHEELVSTHAHLFCCESAGEVIGFCDMHIVSDDAHINEICIEPTHRREGAAHSLVHHAIGLCKSLGCAVLSLEVRSKNEPAVKLYEKCGFERAGLRRDFYRNPDDDAINMLIYFSAR
ncbi:MAG: ribosomal protein S18-alanine N-acetyltransferase [Oscillospiraceae bacterium]